MVGKTLLVLGGSYLQSDFVQVALDSGHDVHVLDRNPECYLANWNNITFKALDISITNDVDAYFTDQKCDIVLSPVTEIGNKVAAYVAKKHKLLYNSLETINATTDKNVMRMHLKNTNLVEPELIVLEKNQSINELPFDYPVIVKPSESSASRGVTRANNREELNKAVSRAKLYCKEDSTILIEQFIRGEQFSVETVTANGVHHIVAIVKEELSGEPYYMERNDIIDIAQNRELLPIVQAFVDELLSSLNVTVGPCHIEVKIDEHKNIRLIEVASRSGLLRDRLIRAAKGSEYNKLILDSYLGYSITHINPPVTNALLGIIAYESDYNSFKRARAQNLVVDSFISENKISGKPTMLTDAVGYYFIQSQNLSVLNNYKVKL